MLQIIEVLILSNREDCSLLFSFGSFIAPLDIVRASAQTGTFWASSTDFSKSRVQTVLSSAMCVCVHISIYKQQMLTGMQKKGGIIHSCDCKQGQPSWKSEWRILIKLKIDHMVICNRTNRVPQISNVYTPFFLLFSPSNSVFLNLVILPGVRCNLTAVIIYMSPNS